MQLRPYNYELMNFTPGNFNTALPHPRDTYPSPLAKALMSLSINPPATCKELHARLQAHGLRPCDPDVTDPSPTTAPPVASR